MSAADPSASPWPAILRQAWDDVKPFHGRFDRAWRIALLCAIVAATSMILKIPEAAISCYLVIFLIKEDAVETCVMAVGVIVLATLVVALMIPLVNATVESPQTRLAVMFGVSFVFLFLSSVTPLGEQAAVIALIVAFIMTLVTYVPIGQIGDQGLLMAWKMACMPMALMILFSLVLGTPSHVLARRKIIDRLKAAADLIETREAPGSLPELLAEGNEALLKQVTMVKALHLVDRATSTWLTGATETSYRVLLAARALPAGTGGATRASLAAQLRGAADRIARTERPARPPPEARPGASPAHVALRDALAGLSAPDGGGAPQPAKPQVLAADAFTNPEHHRYALKTTIAAILCYLIYTGIQWDGIHTAMITVYVAALGTIAETVRKLTLRIVGCLIGAGMGWLVLAFVMPNLTSIGGLAGMVFFGILVGAWIAVGKERIQYVGFQVALAYMLTTLNGFGPSFEISQATNRIYGILLGIFVVYVIFTQFWPKSVAGDIRARLRDALDAIDRLSELPQTQVQDRVSAASEAQIALTKAEELLDIAPFEPVSNRLPMAEIARLQGALDGLRESVVRVSFDEAGDSPAQQELARYRDMLSPGRPREGGATRAGASPCGEPR